MDKSEETKSRRGSDIQPELLRVKQVTALTGIHPRTLLRLRDGEGVHFLWDGCVCCLLYSIMNLCP